MRRSVGGEDVLYYPGLKRIDAAPASFTAAGFDGLANGNYAIEVGKADCERATLEEFKALHGFGFSDAHARYVNTVDLNLGRDMYCKDYYPYPCHVDNYIGWQNADPDVDPPDATVAMERMFLEIVGLHDRHAVAFFVYDHNGNRINSLPLDSEGHKAVPEQCYACHMGLTGNASTLGEGYPGGGQYLPFDVDSFLDWPGQLPRSAQAAGFRDLNDAALGASENKPSLTELIQGWYGAEGRTYLLSTDVYDGSFVPDSWASDAVADDQELRLYDDVYKPFCRTCHVAQGNTLDNYWTRGVNWTRSDAFWRAAHGVLGCDTPWTGPVMPHAERTHTQMLTPGAYAAVQAAVCAEDPPPVPGLPAALSSCAFCHHGDSAGGSPGCLSGPLDLTSCSAIVDVPATQSYLDLVEPGNPESSYLYQKVTNTHSTTPGIGCGTVMPPDGALPSTQLEQIESWIENFESCPD